MNALANLAAACAHCNRFKSDFVTGEAVIFGGEHRLFHPRVDHWDAHFTWSADYLRILPLNGVGDATIQRLHMNDPMPAGTSQTRRARRRESLAVSADSGLSMTALRAVWTLDNGCGCAQRRVRC